MNTCKPLHVMAGAILLSWAAVIFGPVAAVWALTGSISLSQTSGPVGATVHVSGSGFTPGNVYSVKFAATAVMTGSVASDNTIANDFTVPSVPRGSYLVTVTTTSDNSNGVSFAVTPLITLDATSGRAGSQVKVTGSGFAASTAVTILFDSTTVGNATASASGAFSNVAITIPAASEGNHTITAKDSVGSSPAVSFNMASATISLGKASGHVGDQITASGTGFLPNASVTILFDNVSIGTATANASGAFADFAVTVPPGTVGDHRLAARDTIGASPDVTFTTLAPEITLGQSSGKVGDQVTLSGLGFAPDAAVTVLLDTTSFGSVKADASGKFDKSPLTVPSGAQGKHTVTAKDTSNTSPGVSFEIIQSLVINPATGTVGSEVKLNGYGFKPSSVTLDFDGTAQLGNIVADAAGTFSANFKVPEATGGAHTIRVRDGGSNEGTAAFTVVASLTISPDNGSAGTVVKVNGSGFGADAPVVIKYNGAPVLTSPETLKTTSQGSFNAAFEVPASLSGRYTVEASDGTNRASEEFASGLAASISQATSETAPGYVGIPLIIKGAGFNPNASVTVTLSSIQAPIATTKASADGIFSLDFALPPVAGGKHTLTATDGTNTREFLIFIEQQPPAAPLLLKPGPGGKAASPPSFDWKDVTDESGITYAIQIASDELFNNLELQEDGLVESGFTAPKGALKPVTREHPYYWRVKAVDGAANESGWSEPRPFSVGLVITLPNGESELMLSAVVVYTVAALTLALLVLVFLLGRKFAPHP